MTSNFNSLSLIYTFLKWKKHLIVVIIISGIAAVFFSSPIFIKPQFKSFAIIYPSNLTAYSEESSTEQMLQWLFSRSIMDSVTRKHNLGVHYEIDPKSPVYSTLLEIQFNNHVSISKTPFQSIQIDVLDEDPKLACEMVKSILEFLNKQIKSAHLKQDRDVVSNIEYLILKKTLEMDSVEKVLYKIRTTYNIIDYGAQSKEVTKGFLGTSKSGSSSVKINEVNKMKDNLEKKGGDFINSSIRQQNLQAELGYLQQDYYKALRNTTRNFNFTNIVTAPVIAEKKCYPVRSVIILSFIAASLVFSLLFIFIYENRKSLNFKQ